MNESQIIEGGEIEKENIAPKIIYKGEFGTQEFPFKIKIDALLLGDILTNDFHINPEKVNNIEIAVHSKKHRSPSFFNTFGKLQEEFFGINFHNLDELSINPEGSLQYEDKRSVTAKTFPTFVSTEIDKGSGKTVVNLFVGDILQKYEDYAHTILTSNNNKKIKEMFEYISSFPHKNQDSKNRLVKYLKEAPPERSSKFIMSLAQMNAAKSMARVVEKNLIRTAKLHTMKPIELVKESIMTNSDLILLMIFLIGSAINPELANVYATGAISIRILNQYLNLEMADRSTRKEIEGLPENIISKINSAFSFTFESH